MRKSGLTNKIMIILTALCLFLFSSYCEIAKAAGLNTYEVEVINTAKGKFELNGIRYQVDPVFIQQLTDYLNQEDVDINAAQKEEIIGMMFSNVEQGVIEGYLLPVTEEDSEIVENVEDEIDSDNISKHNEKSDGESEKPPEKTSDKEIGNEEVNASENNYTEVIDEIRKQPTTKTEVDQNKNKVTVTKEDNSVLVVNTVIKNTGYNIGSAILAISSIFGILVLCIIITVKYNFFKQEER